MRAHDLCLRELLEFAPDGGEIRFAGQRVLLLDAALMGSLRKYLVENFGFTAARSMLTQFGFAHGWRMAEAIQDQFDWQSKEEWRRAGPRICTLEGLFRVSSGRSDVGSASGMLLTESYEAEQHLLHFGRSDVAVCWTIGGLMSGFASKTDGQQTYVLEDKCMARGDATCHLVAHTREEWGADRADELRFFESEHLAECLDVSLQRVTASLKATEARLHAKRRALSQVAPELEAPLGIIARSPAMIQALDLARRVAKVNSTLLISGESGTGKERIARLVHEESTRAGGPFIAVNCGAITETLLESELFGHRRGSFTGATQDRPGLFEAANCGTLLLDEIGEVSPSMQVKLLRVLQEREVRRVGDSVSRPVDVRVLAATNRDLAKRVASGDFREDLYYRINVVDVHVPALRERRDDILPLARLLLGEAALRLKREMAGLSPAAADQLLRHDWPGNVRELENAMERAVALCRGTRVELEDLSEEIRRAPFPSVAPGDQVRPLGDVTRDYIIRALNQNSGNQARTAEQLKIGSATLYRKLRSYGLTNSRLPH